MPLMSEDRLAPKTVAESRVELTQLMEATDVNIAGTVHGGVVMRLVDTAAGLAAVRHARARGRRDRRDDVPRCTSATCSCCGRR